METQEGHDFLIEFWKNIAEKYKGHPAIYGYDLLNEPHDRYQKAGLPGWSDLAASAIAAIRKIDPTTPIIVECGNMATPDLLEYLPIYPYPNIIYSIHVYNPGVITHQLSQRQKSYIGYDPKEWNRKNAFVDFVAKARQFQEVTGARIFVGEFGCVRWVPGADRWLDDCISVFEEYGWDWCYHAFREWQGWSVEHSDDPNSNAPVSDTKRKQVLLKYFKNNASVEK